MTALSQLRTRVEHLEDHAIGTMLNGRYRIVALMVRGGMGRLYEAEHAALGRRVALKMLHRGAAADPGAVARFQAEAEIAARFQHPHIVQLIDYDVTSEGTPYIVMELLRGETLADCFEREGVPSWSETARLVIQIANGLAAVHAAGVVHRDLKPANVFLMDLPGELPFVKLLDFGVSKCVRRRRRRVTSPHTLVGTPVYMAPEQAGGNNGRLDARADQYALAVVAFELLTGVRPFEGGDLATLVDEVIYRPPPNACSFDPNLPAAVGAVLQRALSKRPEDRFADVIEFAAALRCPLLDAETTLRIPPRSGVGLRHRDSRADEDNSVGVERTSTDGTMPGLAFALDRPYDAVLRLVRSLRPDEPNVSSEVAFVATCLEQGAITLSELLDIIPAPHRTALTALNTMLDRGIIEAAPAASRGPRADGPRRSHARQLAHPTLQQVLVGPPVIVAGERAAIGRLPVREACE